MTSFHTIALPHDDILQGRLTMDVFAADLWEVYKGRGVEEYRDPSIFFQKTYPTDGLSSLLDVVHSRLQGKGGDPVIQVQTPFGGGKTHALIAMYHKATEWDAKTVVIVGTPLPGNETLWGLLAEQLSGSREGFDSPIAPGRDALYELLSAQQPVLILMDEVLEYVTKAAGVHVGDSTLAAQTMAFLQELTEVAGTLEKVSLVVTLPSSLLEHYDDRAEQLFHQMQRVAGRVEKIYTPVQDHEITNVIRCRLFSQVDEKAMKQVISTYMDYANRENLVPAGTEPSEYRERFEASYPFLPEVVDVLYQRWGSFSTFQRTRGVLRLLALVIHDLKDKPIPYISLADFNLEQDEIRRELLKHIGAEFDSVIAADITAAESGSNKVNTAIGKAYQGLKLGSRAATSIFMYSFSGGPERGITLSEIKRSATTLENPASAVGEATERLKGNLFYLQAQKSKYYFTNQPNLNRILIMRMENIEVADIIETERELLRKRIKGDRLKVFPWPEHGSDIPDNSILKLILLQESDSSQMQTFLEKKGETPRVHRNILFFLAPFSEARPHFENLVRKYLAYQDLEEDKTLTLTDDQRKEIKDALKPLAGDLEDSVRRLYRQLYIPGREGLSSHDLGIPTFGEIKAVDEEIYEKLRLDGEILENIAPLVIKEKYLREREWVLTRQLAEAGSKTPGETRVVDSEVWRIGIAEGVQNGLFGLGELENDEPKCDYFKKRPTVSLTGNEILIRAELCEAQLIQKPVDAITYVPGTLQPGVGTGELSAKYTPGVATTQPEKHEEMLQDLRMNFIVPKGKVASLMGVMNYLQSRFENMELNLYVDDGSISQQDYEDKIKEAFRQMGVDIDENF